MSDKASDAKQPEAATVKTAAPANTQEVSAPEAPAPKAAKTSGQSEVAPQRRAPSKPGERKPSPNKASKPKPKAAKAKTAAQKSPARKAVKAKKPVPNKTSATRKTKPGVKIMSAKKETAQETLETVTAASNQAIKEGFEKSLSAMNDASAFNKDTVDAVVASATTASKSIEELNANTVAFAKKSMEDGVTAAKSIASAKSVQEVIEIQTGYTKSSLEAYLAEVNKASDLVSGMFKESFQPLNDRFSAAVEVMQSQR